MARMVRLDEIARVRSGVTLRGSVEHAPAGTLRLVQMKDLVGQHCLNLGTVYRVDEQALGKFE